MSKKRCTLLGAGLCVVATTAHADTVALALSAPLPSIEAELPHLPATTLPRKKTHQRAVPGWAKTTLAASTARQADISAFGLPCEVALDADPMPDALFAVTITAPCRPNAAVAMHYAGLTFDVTTSITGRASFELPAMTMSGRLESVFKDGLRLSTPVEAPDLSEYARVAVAWTQALDMRLIANAPRDMPVRSYTLGQAEGRSVQILSHHQSPEARRAVIRLGVAAPITAQNCGHERHATVRHLQPNTPPISYELMLAATSCDHVGGILELKNILQDLKLAAN